jgi:SRSO17 transposase
MAAMTGGSVEATLELWALSLRDVKGRIRPLFQQARMAVSAGLFLDALLGPERRKTGWMRAEAAGDPGPWRQQALLGRAQGDADALRDVVRDYAVETLSEPNAVLILDETGFLKQGKASCGVARQYTGSAGKITNSDVRCQRCWTRVRHPVVRNGLGTMERVRGAGGRAVKTTVEQTLMRGLVTAFPGVRPGLPRSVSGRR